MPTDDTKRPPNAPLRPVGTYRGPEPAVTKPVPQVNPESPEYGPLILDMLGKVQGSMTGIVGRLDGVEKAVADLTEWRKTGRHAPIVIGESGEPRTASGSTIEAVGMRAKVATDQNLKQDSVISQILVRQAEMDTKVDGLVYSQTEQSKKLQTLDQTVAKTDARKMEILEDVHKRAVSFLDSPLFKLGKTVAYFALAAIAIRYGVKIGP